MSGSSARDVAAIVRDTVRVRVPDGWYGRALPDDTAVGRDGLGLDSIAIVELLLDCEAALGVPFPAAIFETGPLTVRTLIDHARQSVFPSASGDRIKSSAD
jgi:acyl carrier protein